MGRRNIYFEFEDKLVESDFGNWVMILVYAKKLHQDKFLALKTYNVSKSLEEDEVNYNKGQLQVVIEFIDNIVFALKKEEELYEIYPEDRLINLLDNDHDFIYTFLYEDNNLYYDNKVNIELLESIKENILKASLEKNKPHAVYVE